MGIVTTIVHCGVYCQFDIMIVEIEQLREIKKILRRINAKELREIVWTKGGQPVIITEEQYAEYEEYGFSNKDFIDFMENTL
jgi:hypothetical protein